jgi:hypothetical protein
MIASPLFAGSCYQPASGLDGELKRLTQQIQAVETTASSRTATN